MTDDSELLQRIRRDAPGAFDEFVDLYGDRIFGFGMRVCGEREDAKDILQETLIQAYRSLARLEHPAALKSWLFRVAANACRMKRRKGKYEPARELSLDELVATDRRAAPTQIPDPAALPDEEVARSEAGRIIRTAIGKIPVHYRMVLILRDMEQLSTKEVAEALDLAEPTVKMRLHRARLMVKRELEDGLEKGAA